MKKSGKQATAVLWVLAVASCASALAQETPQEPALDTIPVASAQDRPKPLLEINVTGGRVAPETVEDATASPLQGAPETQALSRVVRTREDLQQRGAVTMSQALEVGAAVRLADFDEGLEEDGLWLFSGGDPAALAAMLPDKPRHIALLAYPGMFALDFVGPHAVSTSLMHTQVHILGLSRDPVARGRGLSVTPDTLLKDCPRELDVLFVPGGLEGTAAMMQHTALLDFLRQQAKTSRYVTSVCTGSLILGAAGLLAGRKAATYWSAQHILKDLGALPVGQRVVEDGPFITAGGVTAGLDF